MTADQVLVGIVKGHMMFIQNAHFVEVTIILRKNASKGEGKKRRNLAQLMFHPTDIWNACLRNALDVYLKITWSQNVPRHQKIIINGEGKYVLMIKVIVHVTMAKIMMTIRYTHLWHVCLAMTNVQVKIMVIVCNWPIEFYIRGQRATWQQKFRISFQDH